jgi:flagellar basal-body rod modification protein FlgD
MSSSAIQPITASTPAATGTPASTASTAPSSLASQSVFLQLLVAQLKNQDPQNPADGTAFVTQLAQFSTLEQDTQSANDLNQILNSVQTLTAALPTTPAAAATSRAAAAPAGTSTTTGTH